MFPRRLDSGKAYDIAEAMVDGFNRHCRLFRTESVRQKCPLETREWCAQRAGIWSSCARCVPDERTRWRQPGASATAAPNSGQLA